jgi:hypothetical protein
MRNRIGTTPQMAIDAAKARASPTAALLAVLLVAILGAAFSRPGLAAKSDEPGRAPASSIHAVAESKPYRLYVLGDSLATNLADGLVWALRDTKDVHVVKWTRPATGLVRDDVLDWTRSVTELLKNEKVDIAVIAIGGNDRQDVRVAGKRYERFSGPWRSEYRRRVERFIRAFESKGVTVYWVGLPPVRSKQMSRDYQSLNALYRDIAGAHGIKFIDIFDRFRSASGDYTAYGKDAAGTIARLRDSDGIHFTSVGSRELGEIVGAQVHRDLQSARAAGSASPDNN